ncbi:MAG: glycosyltransferase [Lactobacillus sp.]|jgi:cellulose synthase/poly-beta-1,6-N-acetylglucosamine synthase-like glycosyltransferase|nr:glycosyltransferase [Lactobacillus sp.]
MLILFKIVIGISWIAVVFCLLLPAVLLRLRVPAVKRSNTDLKAYQLYLLVPMHNEANIAQDALDHFLERQLDTDFQYNIHWVVIEDGSTDLTEDQLRPFDKRYPNLTVIYRKFQAATGKGMALNAGLDYVRHKVPSTQWSKTIVGVLDADGQITSAALLKVLKTFAADTQLDMLQTAVAMSNTKRWLALVQDFEFQVFNTLLQNLRGHLKNVAGSGNGQFFRLGSLPNKFAWGQTLLEDFEISTKLLLQAKKTAYAYDLKVYQEATVSWGAYLRQRTRWVIGGLQCLRQFRKPLGQNQALGLSAKVEMFAFMLAAYSTIGLAFTNIVALGMQLYFLIVYGRISLIVVGIIVLGLIMNSVLAYIYRIMAQASVVQAIVIVLTLPFYAVLTLPIAISGILGYVQHHHNWDKTDHGIL